MKTDFYTQLEAIVITNLSKNHIDPELTLVIAPAIIADVVKKFGGEMVYLKNQTKERSDAKHKAILADFNGSNHSEVCQKHGITRFWLNKLLKRASENEEVE